MCEKGPFMEIEVGLDLIASPSKALKVLFICH